jgi:hypothetical protein
LCRTRWVRLPVPLPRSGRNGTASFSLNVSQESGS